MTTKKKPVVRCVVCGVKATRHVAFKESSPVCDNPVCFHTRIDEINKAIIEQWMEV